MPPLTNHLDTLPFSTSAECTESLQEQMDDSTAIVIRKHHSCQTHLSTRATVRSPVDVLALKYMRFFFQNIPLLFTAFSVSASILFCSPCLSLSLPLCLSLSLSLSLSAYVSPSLLHLINSRPGFFASWQQLLRPTHARTHT